jgi:hypothetical protein
VGVAEPMNRFFIGLHKSKAISAKSHGQEKGRVTMANSGARYPAHNGQGNTRGHQLGSTNQAGTILQVRKSMAPLAKMEAHTMRDIWRVDSQSD